MAFNYPNARRDNTVVEDYHGVKVCDPYRWLEDPDSEETKKYVSLQNELAVPYLENCPVRTKLTKRITSLWNYPKFFCPVKEGKFYYYFMNTGLQNQSVLYKQDTLDSEPEVFLDPNEWCKDGLISLSFYEFSDDGEYIAYGISASGSDWNKIKVKKVSNKENLPEELGRIKFSTLSWTHDNKGFFYSCYPDADNTVDGHETTAQKNHTLYYHRIGTHQSEDILCVQLPEHPDWRIKGYVSACGCYVIVFVVETCKDNMIYICNLKTLPDGISGPLPLKCIVGKFEAEYKYVTNEGSVFTFLTNRNSPLYRLVNIDMEHPEEANWKDLIPEDSKKVLDWAVCVNQDKLLVCHREDVKSVLSLHDLRTGEQVHRFSIDVGTISGYCGKKKLSEVFFRFFSSTGTIYHLDLKDGTEIKEFRRFLVPDCDESKFEIKQVFYTSKDGTKVSMFIIHAKDFVCDGTAPAYLYGYDGFNMGLLPYISILRIIFIRHFGGVVVMANLRGGGEYGEMGHREGKLLKKQTVCDGFHAAAEYLIENKYTCTKKLTVNGGSYGGLLIGACVNQRPDLYGCGIANVGVFDMLRFHKFTIGHAWKSEYGCSDNEVDFHNLIKFSPLHNVRVPKDEEVQYPAVLLLTGDHDDRVVPLHSLKFIAELQHTLGNCEKQVNPLLIRVDVQSGHGEGKPTSKQIEEFTDMFCFMCNSLELKYQE